ncbi:MAG: sigma-70 family RNA polymerase sigma factor [Candidatus Binataceae bacterium]
MPPGETALTMVADDSAERLLIEAAQRDPHRFAELYEDNFERVYAYIARRVGDRDRAEDLTADVFHRALASLPRFQWRGVPFAGWLFKIAANAIADHAKRQIKNRQIPDLDLRDDPPLEEVEHRARLFQLVNTLASDQRDVIVMRFAKQKTIREIAAHLGRSEGAVKQLQFRALQNPRVRLGGTND